MYCYKGFIYLGETNTYFVNILILVTIVIESKMSYFFLNFIFLRASYFELGELFYEVLLLSAFLVDG
jgi:hypothetical protein